MNSTQIGDISELKCVTAFLCKGWDVATPVGNHYPYDILVDRKSGLGFERVQVKTSRMTKDKSCVFFSTTRSVNKKRSESDKYVGQVDLICSYCPENEKIYLVDFKLIGKRTTFQIRIIPSKNGQKDKINNSEIFGLIFEYKV